MSAQENQRSEACHIKKESSEMQIFDQKVRAALCFLLILFLQVS